MLRTGCQEHCPKPCQLLKSSRLSLPVFMCFGQLNIQFGSDKKHLAISLDKVFTELNFVTIGCSFTAKFPSVAHNLNTKPQISDFLEVTLGYVPPHHGSPNILSSSRQDRYDNYIRNDYLFVKRKMRTFVILVNSNCTSVPSNCQCKSFITKALRFIKVHLRERTLIELSVGGHVRHRSISSSLVIWHKNVPATPLEIIAVKS